MEIRKALDIIMSLDALQTKRLARYCKRLRSDREVKIFDPIMYRWLLENDASGKVKAEKEYLDSIGYAASQYEYSQIQQQIERFSTPGVAPRRWNKFYKQAVSNVTAELRQASLNTQRFIDDKSIIDALPKRDTHAGFSFILSGMRTKGEYAEGLYDTYCKEISLAKLNKSFNKPILIGSRTQASGAFSEDGEHTNTYKKKTRLVSMIDIYQVLGETVYAKPVQLYLSKLDWYAGGKNDPQINHILRKYADQRFHMFTIDYSSFDQTIPAWLIEDAFEIVRSMFNDREFDQELFDVVKNDFIHKVFIDGDGKLHQVHKGVPSGSMFTQIIDSIVNRVMVLTYSYSKAVVIDQMMIMGDDNIIITRNKLDEKELTSYLSHMFGVVANADKCLYTPPGEDPEFLSRYWTPYGVFRSPEILIAKLLYPENFRNYKKDRIMTPELIAYSYYLSFPLGIDKIINMDALDRIRRNKYLNRDLRERNKWLSGLERYRASYTY